MAILDLNGFKQVNDEYDHAEGDRVLRMVAQRLRRLHGDDTAARIGGDEFALIMPGHTAKEANALIAHLERRSLLRGVSQHASRRRSRPADTG